MSARGTNMKKGYITKFLDTLITFLASAFFSCAIAGYFLNGWLTIIAASVACGVAITALTTISQGKKSDPNKLKIKEMLTQFIYNDSAFCLDFFYKALKQKYDCELSANYIKTKSSVIFPVFVPRKLNHTELASMYAAVKACSASKLIILCSDGLDKEAGFVVNQLPGVKIEIMGAEKVFSLLTYLNYLPQNEIVLIKQKNVSIKEFLKVSLNGDRAKSYFFTSLVLILSSFILPYGLYYTIVSAICLALGIVAKSGLIKKFIKNQDTLTPLQ